MHITDDPEERVAIIMESCKVSEKEAIRIMNQKDFSGEVERLRQMATLQRMKSKRGIDRKTLAGGNDE
jgi:hypothetical protein